MVLNYVREKVGADSVEAITILPGMPYGHLVLSSPVASKALIESLQEANATFVGKRVLVFFHTTLRKDDMKKSTIVDFPDARPAFTGAIPGLYIFDNFVTDAESNELIQSLDAKKWKKLLNRRV